MNQKYTALVLMAVLAVALLSTFTVLPDLNEKAYAMGNKGGGHHGHHGSHGHHGGGGHGGGGHHPQ
jgi:hypothetical protein